MVTDPTAHMNPSPVSGPVAAAHAARLEQARVAQEDTATPVTDALWPRGGGWLSWPGLKPMGFSKILWSAILIFGSALSIAVGLPPAYQPWAIGVIIVASLVTAWERIIYRLRGAI